jgi:hypothetical protein
MEGPLADSRAAFICRGEIRPLISAGTVPENHPFKQSLRKKKQT